VAYVRMRGNQVAIVQGARHPKTKKVEQEVLFTLYSKAEAKEALGKEASRFRMMLEQRHPNVRFNWDELRRGIAENLDALPENYDYRSTRLQDRFKTDLARFAKQVVLADPEHLAASAELLRAHRGQLEYLRELLDWRLTTPDAEPHEYNRDNEFLWRFEMRGDDVPPDVEEHASAFFERGEYEKARAAFGLLTAAFDDYADGHNKLGLIALEEGKVDEAIVHFERTVEIGRRVLPKRIAKDSWWTDLDTRPFMRGLGNLALAQNQAGRYDDALTTCRRLETECHDDITAASHRAAVFLNTRKWQHALDAALHIHQVHPSESLIAAFAAFELGRQAEARKWFLHAMLNAPRTVGLVLGMKLQRPSTGLDAEDHNGGVGMSLAIDGYLRGRRPAARRFFDELWKDSRVTGWRNELAECSRRWSSDRSGKDRGPFDSLSRMRSLEFAEASAQELGSGAVPATATSRSRSAAKLRLVH
jgi:tetratricopeptide (TPR) repeat protein